MKNCILSLKTLCIPSLSFLNPMSMRDTRIVIVCLNGSPKLAITYKLQNFSWVKDSYVCFHQLSCTREQKNCLPLSCLGKVCSPFCHLFLETRFNRFIQCTNKKSWLKFINATISHKIVFHVKYKKVLCSVCWTLVLFFASMPLLNFFCLKRFYTILL